MSLISVIVPTHNRQEWLVEALHSIYKQTYRPIEVIVVDDGSAEDIKGRVMREFGDQAPTVLRNDEPTGPGAARNLGVANASGEYIAFLDSDDIWYPHKLAEQYAVIRQDPDIGFVGGGCDYMTAQGEPTLKPTMPPAQATYEDFLFKIKMPGSGSNNLIRKSAFDEVQGFREDLMRAEDKHLWLKLLKRYRVGYVQDVLATVRVHGTVRINVNEDITLANRLAVDNEIEDSGLRRKAKAFTYYVVFSRLWQANKWQALLMLLRSFFTYPFAIAPDIKRLRGAIDKFRG
ncbi:glycosyltransferase family A protein [Alteromonas sp. ASW11-36]|uniref:Glycosyltransferase family A protein n=1 Tax=Alteromonas arenosi TaxID=3055817 RepID=A0ABT7STW7_9ALTE|nr:glycosyltransferase family A protein [Alteromonas sp. ASW11-36]MDM7859638.1 glycosyltransferase family A protein [Alteromonas sp. ASW11-36]